MLHCKVSQLFTFKHLDDMERLHCKGKVNCQLTIVEIERLHYDVVNCQGSTIEIIREATL